jgi:coenzyme F420 hydrogenase subunit beta
MGSVGSMSGWTSTIIRTERGLAAFERARSKLDVRTMDDPDALVRLDNLDKRIAFRSLERTFDPDAPLFVDYEDHIRDYADSDRHAVVSAR